MARLMDHLYVSTACQHMRHDYCQAETGRLGPKKPGVCKFCDAPCLCPCHGEESEGGQ